MRFLLVILFFITCFTGAKAQVAFSTSVKKGPVVVGEAFSVQYVLEDNTGNREFHPPEFRDFRFVSGPNIYVGEADGTDGPRKLKNIMYTLEAVKPGRFRIQGATARDGDQVIRSNDVWLEVITAAEAAKRGIRPAPGSGDDAAYILRPGEDPQRKMRDNLFLKVTVDKNTCFVGEAVTATFKLYSRLMSRSDIVRNPGFYGFTVQDMIGLDDRQTTTETINGKKFDVHTIRKVQLYPLRAGSFFIDPMEIVNKVEFSRSRINRPAGQEIVEGVAADEPRAGSRNTEEYESSMHSSRLAITVKEPPLKNRPESFLGATGHFTISATIEKNELAKNEEGRLVVTVSGAGNFTQLGQPVIQWPAGIEQFEPQVTDSLDHTVSPLGGTRLFRFSFAAARPGQYRIPAIQFSFFDPDSNRYKTIASSPLQITVHDQDKPIAAAPVAAAQSKGPGELISIIAVVVLCMAAGAGYTWWRKKRKVTRPAAQVVQTPGLPTVDEILQPAFEAAHRDPKLFYTTLRQCTWQFFLLYAGLTGSAMNNRNLITILEQKQVDETCRAAIVAILEQCDTGIFTGVRMETDQTVLLQQTKEMLEKIARCFNA